MFTAGRGGRPYLRLCGFVALLGATLLVYSQTLAFTWDEGFHLLAAQLIGAGKTPYLDFCFPQTTWNTYWMAAWMRIFGESWRLAHLLAALLTTGAVMLAADYVYSRLPISRWRMAAAFTAALLIGLNSAVFEHGAVGQAYGMCLFATVAAFRAAVAAKYREGAALPALAGFLAGVAAASTLLSAAALPVLLTVMDSANVPRPAAARRIFSSFSAGSAQISTGPLSSIPSAHWTMLSPWQPQLGSSPPE